MFAEEKNRGHMTSGFFIAEKTFKDIFKDQIPMFGRVMDAVARQSVVSIADNGTGLGVYCVPPLVIVGGDGYDEVL